MSILNVEHLTHGFGDRAIFSDVSFRLLKGEHIGLVGANGEGKSTFMSIVTGKLMPDEGKVEWAKNVRAGYLDQHAVLEKGMTIQEVLKSAFDPLLQKEQRMNEICDLLGSADEEEMNVLIEELCTIQDELTLHDFYVTALILSSRPSVLMSKPLPYTVLITSNPLTGAGSFAITY